MKVIAFAGVSFFCVLALSVNAADHTWSSSYTPADPIHDSYHSAAYILQKLKQVGDAAQSMSYWVFTDIFEEAGPRFEAFHGGFGLINLQGIKKPAYFAYQFLNRLGPFEVKSNDPMSWATADNERNVQLLFRDYTYTLPEGLNNQQFYVQDLPAEPKGQVAIQVDGLNPGQYTLEVRQVGYQRNDAFSAYIAMGTPAQLSRAQVETLKTEATGSALERREIQVGSDGGFSTRLPLRENDVYLLELSRF